MLMLLIGSGGEGGGGCRRLSKRTHAHQQGKDMPNYYWIGYLSITMDKSAKILGQILHTMTWKGTSLLRRPKTKEDYFEAQI